jgi:DNA-binding response OmpR family regulator
MATKQVFLMDDSAFALDLVRMALVEDGVRVTCGRDLADLTRLKGQQVDLVLMDVEMPEAFGDDLASWLISENLEAPVYLLSNLPVDQLERRAAECGARGFISKSLGLDAVLSHIRALMDIRATGRSLAPTLLIGDFLSMAHGRVRRARAAITSGDRTLVANEMHTLSGEAALLGLDDVARAAAAVRANLVTLDVVPAAALDLVITELAQAATRAKVPIAPIRTGTARILLLDDSDFYRSTLMGLLEDSGYEVVEVRRLADARHRMRDGRYDLVILDLQLEDGCGAELIPELRQHAPGARLLLLSGADVQEHHAADLMLSKSVEAEELLGRIDELVRVTPRVVE